MGSRPSADSLAEVVAPALREYLELGGASHALDVVAVAGEETRDFRHAKPVGVPLQLDDRVAGCDVSLSGDGEVEAKQAALEEFEHELVALHLDPELEAREAWLSHDEFGRADAEAVADADVAVEEAFGGQVLAERARAEVELRPLMRPELVELGRVGVDGLLRTAVDPEIGLAVALEVEPAQRHVPGDRFLCRSRS
jgi:hypothetical protein